MTDATWFALQVRARTELRIAEDLRSEGHLVFVPFQIVPPAPRERPSLSPPLEHRWPYEHYQQRLGRPRMPRPEGDGWEKVGGIRRDKTWVTRWCDQRHAYVFGPSGERVQLWRRARRA